MSLEAAGVTSAWADAFVRESNSIDAHPGPSEPGDALYDNHMTALVYCVLLGVEDRYALPDEVHRLILKGHPLAGVRRHSKGSERFDLLPRPLDAVKAHWWWNRDVHRTIESLRGLRNRKRYNVQMAASEVWRLHVQFEAIHPYEVYNGKVGRLLMVNHALLAGLEPWAVADCEDYFRVLQRVT